MRAYGNGDPHICAQNLLQTWRGEVPYDRLKGIDTTLIDRPIGVARPAMEADANWVIKTYEPRVTPSDAVTRLLEDGEQGDLSLSMGIVENSTEGGEV